MKTLQKIGLWLVAAAMSTVLYSCEDVIDPSKIGDPASTPRLVVDALLQDTTNRQVITLSWSQRYFDNSRPQMITNAEVQVTELLAGGATNVYPFTHDATNPGSYVSTAFRTQERTNYQLRVIHEGDTYTAASYCPRRIQWVQTPGGWGTPARYDSLYFRFFKPGLANDDSLYRPQLVIWDTPGEEDQYRLLSFMNGRLLNRPANINVYRPTGPLDGRPFIPPAIIGLSPLLQPDERQFKQFDTCRVVIQCIDRASYEYWLQVEDQVTNGGLFAEPPFNVPCNVVNTRSGGRQALGWFGTATTLTREAIIDRRKNVEVVE